MRFLTSGGRSKILSLGGRSDAELVAMVLEVIVTVGTDLVAVDPKG